MCILAAVMVFTQEVCTKFQTAMTEYDLGTKARDSANH